MANPDDAGATPELVRDDPTERHLVNARALLHRVRELYYPDTEPGEPAKPGAADDGSSER